MGGLQSKSALRGTRGGGVYGYFQELHTHVVTLVDDFMLLWFTDIYKADLLRRVPTNAW